MVLFQHRTDPGGPSHTVAIQIPEAQDRFVDAIAEAQRLRARVLLLCDTATQARRVGKQAQRALPEHIRVSIERAAEGGWSLS